MSGVEEFCGLRVRVQVSMGVEVWDVGVCGRDFGLVFNLSAQHVQ